MVMVAQSEVTAEAAQAGFLPALECLEQLLDRLSATPSTPVPAEPPGSIRLATAVVGLAAKRLSWLANAFGLCPFDLELLLLALAPELDLRYAQRFASLQGAAGGMWPSLGLALRLLCADPHERLLRRGHVAPAAPLVRHGLLRLIAHQPGTALPACGLALDAQVARVLLGEAGLDPRLAPFCDVVAQLDPCISMQPQPLAQLTRIAAEVREGRGPRYVQLIGGDPSERQALTGAVAREFGIPLLAADLTRLPPIEDPATLLRLLFREAWFTDSLLLIEGCEPAHDAAHARVLAALLRALANDEGLTLLGGAQPLPLEQAPGGVVVLPLRPLDPDERRACWRASLAAAGRALPEPELGALAERFRLSPRQIVDAVAVAAATSKTTSFVATLFELARDRTGLALGALARRVRPSQSWPEIVLPDETLTQLHELCARARGRRQVLDEWGFGRRLANSAGVSALFTGGSGTGKTMAAEVLAGALGLDLYVVDLAGVVSKYIGETEKNLDQIFAAAESAAAVLFFDEADALFGKRSAVQDAHDRYANIEIAYLLQRMERHDGITILATNLSENLDDAFLRRLAFSVHFPFPDAGLRLRIWELVWPAGAPLGPDVRLDVLAERFPLSGGNIRNVALAAAFLAADEHGPITMARLLRAVAREYEKLGRRLSDAELEG